MTISLFGDAGEETTSIMRNIGYAGGTTSRLGSHNFYEILGQYTKPGLCFYNCLLYGQQKFYADGVGGGNFPPPHIRVTRSVMLFILRAAKNLAA
jgi:hypothetical protein